MKACEWCSGKGWRQLSPHTPMEPGETDKCFDCEDGWVFENEQEKRLYEVLMT